MTEHLPDPGPNMRRELRSPVDGIEAVSAAPLPVDQLRGELAELAYANAVSGHDADSSAEAPRHALEAQPDYGRIQVKLETAAEQAATLDSASARELTGLAYQLNLRAQADGDETLQPAFDQLKKVIYGTSEVSPLPDVTHELAQLNEQRGRHLNDSYLVQSTGASVRIETLDPETDLAKKTPTSTVKLIPGPQDVWLVQIGDQPPVTFDDDSLRPSVPDWDADGQEMTRAADNNTVILGRGLLNGPTAIARQHTKLECTPEGIVVTDVSSSPSRPNPRTRVVISGEFPDPAEFRSRLDANTREQELSAIRDNLASL